MVDSISNFHIESKSIKIDPYKKLYHPPYNKETNDAVLIQATCKCVEDAVPIDEWDLDNLNIEQKNDTPGRILANIPIWLLRIR